jgi:hypothetical protein
MVGAQRHPHAQRPQPSGSGRYTRRSSRMFSSLVSCRTNCANSRLGRVVDHRDQVQLLSPPFRPIVLAGVPLHQLSIAAPPRPPYVRLLHLLFLGRYSFPRIIHCRTVSLLASMPCFFPGYSAPSVGLNPRYTSADRIFTASHPCSLRSSGSTAFRATRGSGPYRPRFFRQTAAASPAECSTPVPRCVISLFLAFFNVTSRSLSACVISSCPSCIPQAWGCQEDISIFLLGSKGTLSFCRVRALRHAERADSGSAYCFAGGGFSPVRPSCADAGS